jgi:hypothetical protein
LALPTRKDLATGEGVKVCCDGAVKSPANETMTNVPNDETIKDATGISSSKTV